MTYHLFISCFLEIPSPSSPQGAKHMTLPASNKEMDPKRAAALLDRRRVSASVSEIRDLYSALQELVPGSAACSLSHRALPEEHNPMGVSSSPNSPKLRRRSPSNDTTERSLARSPTSEEESLRVRRLLPVTPNSTSSPKINQALDVNANLNIPKGKRKPNMERRGSSGEVFLSIQTGQTGKASPNLGRRGSSGEVLLGVRANQLKSPKSPLAMVRSASNQDLYRTAQNQTRPKSPSPLKLDRLVSPEVLARRGSEGVLLTPNMNKQGKKLSPLKMGRRGSSGDILTSEGGRMIPIPPSPLASPRYDGMFEPHSQGPSADSSPRRTLKNALAKFSNSFKKKTPPASPEPKETSAENNEAANQSDVVDGPARPRRLLRLESQMDMLLNSLNDLEGSSKEPLHVSMSDPLGQLDQRRGSLGAEMQKLLGALQELCPGSDSDSPGELETRSRGGSVSVERVPVERESLDQLEAYFTEKLRDATKAEARSKTPSERSSESEAPHSDKEDGEVKQSSSALSSKKTSLEDGSVDEGIDLVDHPTEVITNDSGVKQRRSKEHRDEFANQVNKKLHDWLEKAMTLAQQEKEKLEASGKLTTSEREELKYDSLDSDESDGNKDKEPKKLRRNLFNKLSLLRRGDKSRAKYKHRRTRSMHDVTISLESERQQDDDAVVQSESTTEEAERKSRRPSTVTRSRSLYNVGHTQNKNRTKDVKEAEDVPVSDKDLETNTPDPMPKQEVTQRSQVINSSSKDFDSSANVGKTLVTAEKPKASNTPREKPSENKNVKRLTPKKRLRRLPTDLPIFYSPEAEKSCNTTPESTKQTDTQIPPLNRKQLFSQNGVIYAGMEDSFYTEKTGGDIKMKKADSHALPYPRILVNESSNYFFGNRIEGEVTLVYPSAPTPPSSLRRFASMDSFLNSKDLQDCEAPEPNGISNHSNKLLPDDIAENRLLRRVSDDQSPGTSPPSHVWDMEVTI